MPDTGSGFVYFRSGADRAADDAEDAPEQQTPEPDSEDKGKDKPDKEPKTTAEDDDYPEDGTIPEVKDWIGDDVDRAQTAYDREQERPNPRSTLLDYLDDLLSDDDA